MDDEDENRSLLPERSPVRRSRRDGEGCNNRSTGILTNRIIILVLLTLFVTASVYFQSQVSSLKDELVEEEKTVHELVQKVTDHAEVIRRFNESVTNSDIVKQMHLLGATLNATKGELEQEMDRLQAQVTRELDGTLAELGDTVRQAKEEISRQVDHVKKDVDQYVITTQDQFSMENSFMVYQLAGTLTLLSCLISMWHMTAHLRKMQEPVVQRKILAILWMPPIYAVTSWFSLVFHSAEGYFAIIKDAYEAYIIYQFLSFCIAVLGKGDRNKVVDILAKRADHLTPPFRCYCWCWCDKDASKDPYENNPRALADAILLQCQIFCMQFVFLRPLTTIATVALEKMQYYGGGESANDYRAPQVYIAIIQNISVFTAFAGLLKFYHAVDKDLQWCRPFAKFLCIKGVVFMTFWQGLAIIILADTTDVGGGSAEEWAKSAQNFMICLEMLLFSIAHFYCFPTDEWDPGYRQRASRGLAESLALGDFVQDLKLILKSGKKRKSKKPSEPTVAEGNEEVDDDATEGTSIVSSSADLGADLEATLRERIADDDEEVEDDEEVAGAKERLNLLAALPSSLINGVPSEEDNDAAVDSPRSHEKGEGNSTNSHPATPPTPPTETTGLLNRNNRTNDSISSDEEDSVPRTKNEDVLKPSIFTTIGKLSS